MKRTRAANFPRFLAVLAWLLSSSCCAVNGGGTRAASQQQQPPEVDQHRRRAFAFNPRIVGGNTARNGRYPYAEISLATETGLHQCGGSLIAPDVILTAGHCHGFFSQIRVDIYNIKANQHTHQIFKAERMHFHPNFDELWFRYDFLLLQLNGTVEGLEPVRINADDKVPKNGDPLTVVGWGLTDPDDSTAYPDTLKEVTVNYLSNKKCEETTSKGQRLYQGYIFNDMMCAREEGKDACSGDSGAPLIRRGSTPDQDVVVAVVSWGNGCATDYPGVYARISYQYQWIKDVVCGISKFPPASFRCARPTNLLAANPAPTIAAVTAPVPVPVPVPVPDPTAGLRPSMPFVPRPPMPSPTLGPNVPEGYLPIKVEIQLDLRSKDTGWSLVTNTGEVVAQVDAGEYTTPYELVEQMVYLPKSSQFVFIMKDAEGDGICCEFGGGWYQVGVVLTDGNIKPLVKGYGTFALSSTNVFQTPLDNYPILSLGIAAPAPPLEDVLAPPQGVVISNNNSMHEPMVLADVSLLNRSSAVAGYSLALATAMSFACLLLMG